MIKPYRFLKYVIHEHFANKAGHHYDLRIEYPNKKLIASWAIPKHIFPKEIGDKVLTVKVNDHGRYWLSVDNMTIDEGEYGAGKIKLIQKGIATVYGWSDTHVTFKIEGTIATGTFTLIKFKPKGNEKVDTWVMIRIKDKV
jgi:bifunctional non-homologous end joining protein LigD